MNKTKISHQSIWTFPDPGNSTDPNKAKINGRHAKITKDSEIE